MKSNAAHIATLASLLLSLVVAEEPALDEQPLQDGEAAAQAPKVEPRYVTVEDIEGADLRIPSSEPGEEPSKDSEVQDVLIDTRTGELGWAVVKVGGRQALIPCKELRWDVAQECFATDRSRAELEASPEFDVDKAEKTGLEGAVVMAERGWRERYGDAPRPATDPADADKDQVREASAQRVQTNPRYLPSSEPWFRASHLDELELFGGSEEFGGVTRSIVDVAGGRVEFFVVSRGGVLGIGDDDYLIPFRAVTLCRSKADEGAEPALCIDRTVSQLESATRYEKPEDGVLDSAQASRARSSFSNGD